MTKNVQEIKGRAKQAAGDLTDDKNLKREGEIDQAGGRAKEKVGEVSDKAKAGLDKLTGKPQQAGHGG